MQKGDIIMGYIVPCFDVLHSFSREYIIENLAQLMKKKGLLNQNSATHLSWRDMVISEKVKSMTLGPSELSKDTRSDKDLLAEALEEKYNLQSILS